MEEEIKDASADQLIGGLSEEDSEFFSEQASRFYREGENAPNLEETVDAMTEAGMDYLLGKC